MTRRRLLLIALIVLLLGLIGGAGVRAMRRDGEARATEDSSPGAIGAAESREERSPRRTQGAGAAEAKLKSLLAVREGEMAFIRVPAGLMPQLTAGRGDGAPKATLEHGDHAPGMVGVLSRSKVLERLTDAAGSIDGKVDVSGDDFEWRGERMQVRGTARRQGETLLLELSVTEGENALASSANVPPGSVVFLRSKYPDPEGMLIVIGKSEPADDPAGDWEEK
jgi:hypothetical protein